MSVDETFITLDYNRSKILGYREELRKVKSIPLETKAQNRKDYFAATGVPPSGFGPGDISAVQLATGKFIDLNIHADTFLNDIAANTTANIENPLFWKTRSSGVLGMTVGALQGKPPQHLFNVSDNYEQILPIIFNSDDVIVPNFALTQDPTKLGIHQLAQERKAESIRLALEQYLANVITYQPIGTGLATSFYNYATATANPYNGKAVYVVDRLVQSGTYDTTNIVDVRTEGGLTPTVFYSLITQMLLSRRTIRTLHVPVVGTPWRELIKFAQIVSNANAFGPGARTNPNLTSVPADQWDQFWNLDQMGPMDGSTLELPIFGVRFKIKANNRLPQGVAVVTTNEPAAEVIEFTGNGHNIDGEEPYGRDKAFSTSWSKRTYGFAQPDPWVRNWFCLIYDTPVAPPAGY